MRNLAAGRAASRRYYAAHREEIRLRLAGRHIRGTADYETQRRYCATSRQRARERRASLELSIPERRCACGCGGVTQIADRTVEKWGWVKEERKPVLKGHGRHRSDPVLRFWSYVDRTGDCWIWTGSRLRGRYGLFRVVPSEPMRRTHCVSWEWANGIAVPEGVGVLHKCDNPPCVNPAHLFLGTQLDNMRDCRAKGRMPLGEQRHSAKLTAEKVKEIRSLVSSGRSMSSVARDFGVSAPTIRAIVRGERWRWVA